MNAILPTGVEQYLKEAGFSATEMLVLRKLVEEDSLTIRELASKTGKSTGVLDQAMKKLMTKKIAQKNVINDQPRYSINSLDAVLRWVKNDMLERKSTLERRHENFESFIATLKVDKKRPDIEHFHGAEGMKQAYLKLLESGQELLTVTPILHLTEEDPFRSFRVEYFRKRQVRKIFQRILAPDSTLARRFQSRDAFEYRKTLLASENELPVAFEKTIVGDTIACFNFDEESACFLKYPDLAKAERAAFETLWNRQMTESHEERSVQEAPAKIALKTRIFSSLREFVLSRKSLAAFAIFSLVAGAMTFGLYQKNRDLNLERLHDKVLAIAVTGALQFKEKDIDAVKNADDINKKEYATLVATLDLIRRSNPGIQFVYLMRKTDDPKVLAFIADAESLNPSEKKDVNKDGSIDETDALNTPGELYINLEYPKIYKGFDGPVKDTGKDKWGSFISAYAPVKNSKGESIAILGIDVFDSELDKISSESFTPVYFFIVIFFIFLFARFIALNKSLVNDCADTLGLNLRKSIIWALFFLVFLFGLFQGKQFFDHQRFVSDTGKRLMAIATTATNDFDVSDLNQLHFARDMKTEAYQRVFRKLNEIRAKNPEITVAYIVRPTNNPIQFEFIADSDANYNLPQFSNLKINDLDFDEFSDESTWPGYIYEDFFPVFRQATKRPAYGYAPVDKWGSTITGMAPIFENGQLAGILSLDVIINKADNLN